MYRRLAETELVDALEDTPVVLVHGPRQTGKSTLVQSVGQKRGAAYLSLDDPIPRSRATEDPAGLLEGYKQTLIIDEVQRAPQLFLALKASIDRDRRPARFILTGSANVFALPKIADSLAGRISIVDLSPLAQCEIEGVAANFVDRIFEDIGSVRVTDGGVEEAGISLGERMARGGYPEPLSRAKPNRRDAWFADYVRTLLERDVRDFANIDGLAQMPRLLKLLAVRCGSSLNVADLAAETRIPNTSLHRYLDLLKAIFLTFQVPAWSFEEAAKLAKSPKTFLVDSGLVCYLRSLSAEGLGRDPDVMESVMKNFVATELQKLCGFSVTRPALFHLRTVRRLEVDFVLESRGGEIIGIQVTGASQPLPAHLEGLSYLRELAGDRFKGGVLLTQGGMVEPVGTGITSMPVSALWS
jgi:predicted AAA+ superfamily ATPase